MTNLTNFSVQNGYGDTITCTNNGAGLTNVLQNIQDGLGNNSAIQLSRTTINITGILQFFGTNVLTAGGPLVVPTLAGPGDPPVVNGGIYYNQANTVIRACVNGVWVSVQTA